ncbi:translation initiation factor IF-2 [Helicobacter sp. MIT 14-3879]|uniref:translation initiation factor IF-2 n=1 Tax=Helicobacter sp. MIT 14-3879 TaxID=2040649 RepID=UPI000E1E71DD|nr:translation initiation factor IF-2 [Helicobacter sp. MIT 14-3879]RDU65610.1 translation initiation factor IF-2 [Helicobacter sp. MIT 14-3879]
MGKEQKVKVSEIALELGMQSKEIIAKALEIDINIKSANSSVTDTQAEDIYNYIAMGKVPQKKVSKVSKTAKAKKEEKELKEAKKSSKKETKKSKAKKEEKECPKEEPKKEYNLENEVKKIETRKIIVVSKNTNTKTQDNNSEKLTLANEIKDKILHPNNLDYEKPKKEKRKKKEHKKTQSHKENEQKIDLNRNLGDTNIDDDNEVMLFDLNEMDNEIEVEEKSEEKITDRVRIQRANPWFFDSIGRERKKGKRSFKKVSNSNANQSTIQKNNNIIKIPDEIRVYEFADRVGLRVTDIISKLFKMGEMVTKNDFLDTTIIEILAQEFDLKIEISKAGGELEYLETTSENEELIIRSPIVTIMGHVDHGKTSLLDYIRNSRISKNEQGGITQHIGAYMVEKNNKSITFIDTPGHEAFAAMRSRGAQVTDIAIIVIAADDGVKQQTKEALSHAKEANVQIIIAMNKMDKENANPDKIKTEMAEIGYTPADWGGEYDFIPISAKSGLGIDDLLDTILIQAELMDLKSNILSQPKAIILEGSLDKGKGPVVTVIVQEGVLKVGDSVVADTAYGKVRALIKDNGEKINELKPSEIAILTGLSEVPNAGAILVGVEDETKAKEYATKRKSYLRSKELSKSTKVMLDELSSVVANSKLKPLLLIIKTDTQGSLEAIKASLESLSNDEIKINIISSSVGNITENDISIAQSNTDCYILGFNIKPLGKVKLKAKEQNVSIKSYSVIYSLIDDVKEIIENMMSPTIEEEVIGNVEVRDIFSIGKGGVIAGCFVNDGIIHKSDKIKLLRGSKVIYTGMIASLKRFKDDVKEVSKGYECGIMLDSFNDIKIGDNFEVIKEVYKKQKI